jgi:hypothetical protein
MIWLFFLSFSYTKYLHHVLRSPGFPAPSIQKKNPVETFSAKNKKKTSYLEKILNPEQIL